MYDSKGSQLPETSAEAEADESLVLWKSPLGYSMTYDSSIFTLESNDTLDAFTCISQENIDTPVSISVQSYPDMPAEDLANGLVLQSGVDGVTADDTSFGADNVESKMVCVEKEVDSITQLQVFHVISLENGSLLVEIGSYTDVPDEIDRAIEAMLDSFSISLF
jgi:hypothetical protein